MLCRAACSWSRWACENLPMKLVGPLRPGLGAVSTPSRPTAGQAGLLAPLEPGGYSQEVCVRWAGSFQPWEVVWKRS